VDQQFPSFTSISMDDSPALALPFEYNAAAAFVDDALQDGRGNRVAIRTANRNWTYADLDADVNRVGNVLHALGVDMEQRVALLSQAIRRPFKNGCWPTAPVFEWSPNLSF